MQNVILFVRVTVPSLYNITLPFLQALNDSKPHSHNEIVSHLENFFNLTEADKNMQTKSGQKVLHNRVYWAKFELKKAGLLLTDNKQITITEDGLEILNNNNPDKINRAFLLNISQYQNYFNKDKDQEQETIQDEPGMSPDDHMDLGYKKHREKVEYEILEKIQNNSPEFFEGLVVKLIKKMGYGTGKSIGKSGDGGIDGMIDGDKLGLSKIYLQAKRLNNSVSVAQVRDFAGAMTTKTSNKGIFITTSDFTESIHKFLNESDKNIVIINGKQLAELMFDHDIGFSKVAEYTLKTIDEDFFTDSYS